VPNCSAFGKRNRFGNVTSALRLFEIALVLVRFDHVASIVRNADHRVMSAGVENRSQLQQLQAFTVTETGTHGRSSQV